MNAFVRFLCALGAAIFAAGIASNGALAETRVALVIGNGAYKNAARLPNPANDATDVAAALKRAGFETILATDLDRAGMDEATIRFARAARTADIAMFYYSGHALQFGGVNYLVPVDAKLTDEADLRRMTRVDEVVADLAQAKNLRILVLDSCRDNPLADELKRSIGASRAMSLQRGLAKIDSPQGMIVAYATQAGRTAEDGSGHNSPYTTTFLKHIDEKEEIGAIFRRVSADVYESTRHEQLPELSLSLIGEFYLHGRVELAIKPAPADPCASATEHWKAADAIGTAAAFEDHLARFPSCTFAGLAKARIEALKTKIAVVSPTATASLIEIRTAPFFKLQTNARATIIPSEKGRVQIKVTSGSLSANPKFNETNMYWFEVGFCGLNERGWTQVNMSRVINDRKVIDINNPLNLNGLAASVQLPADDPELRRHWVCTAAGVEGPNSQLSFMYAHATDASVKGCPGCLQ